MIEQIFRLFRAAVLRDVVRRRDHHVTLRRPERDRDHVLRQMLAVAHAGIEARFDDVDKRRLSDHLQFDLRILFQERRDHRLDHEIDRRRRRVDAQPADGTPRNPRT